MNPLLEQSFSLIKKSDSYKNVYAKPVSIVRTSNLGYLRQFLYFRHSIPIKNSKKNERIDAKKATMWILEEVRKIFCFRESYIDSFV